MNYDLLHYVQLLDSRINIITCGTYIELNYPTTQIKLSDTI